jgi:hypothetical protein
LLDQGWGCDNRVNRGRAESDIKELRWPQLAVDVE